MSKQDMNARVLLVFVNAVAAVVYWTGGHSVVGEWPQCAGAKLTKRPDFRSMHLEAMMPVDLVRYVYWTNSSSCRIAHDFGGVVTGIVYDDELRFIDGQKTVCLDARWRPTLNDCLVYSFGVNDEWSFDEQMERYGCQIYAFDPSMDSDDHDHTANIHYYNMGIGPNNTDPDRFTEWKLRTLDTIYQQLQTRHGPVAINILKIDVEHDEWVSMPQLMASGILQRVQQLQLEIHFYDKAYSTDQMRRCLSIVKALEDSGWIRFASRPAVAVSGRNMAGKFSFTAFEMSFYNSKFQSQEPT